MFSNTFCVARDFVSFHFPSQRLMLCILSEILKWLPSKERLRTTLNKSLTSEEHNWNEKTVLNIVDIALCPLVLSQQILANMWTRNGSSKMYRQVSLYYSHFWTHTGLDMDIFGLQLGIEYLGANRVLSQMLERFDVVNYFVSSSSSSSYVVVFERGVLERTQKKTFSTTQHTGTHPPNMKKRWQSHFSHSLQHSSRTDDM